MTIGNRSSLRLVILGIAALLLMPMSVWAHHGWGWATDEEFEITGVITEVRLGYPHGEVTITSEDQMWLVEVGQPYRHKNAGLDDESLVPGVVVTIHGHRSLAPDELVVKAERVIIDGVNYNLYPDRES